MRKKYILPLFIAAFAAFLITATPNTRITNASSAYAETAMEVSTQKVLSAHCPDLKLPMASTTKIMTALIVCEDCNPDQVVTVPDCAVGVEGSSIYLKKGEEIDIRDLLYGLMLRSGNDSAVALAVIHSGSVEKFVEKMNIRARELGAKDTNFKNPNGLPDDEHYTTASDLCKITCAAMQNQLFRQVAGTKSWKGKYRSYANKNKMLYNYEGATGVKTGYTVKAGRCLVSSAKRGQMEVVCVVLNVYDMYARSADILDECFNKYDVAKIDENQYFMCNKVLCKIPQTYNFVVEKGKEISYKIYPYNKHESAENGGAKGKIEIYQENNLLLSENLYSIV